ncbi:fimbrial protein [Caballeronia sp. EK]|uniref:fimbrial protein n=1 Tax=Caballeronia sp. EK TaxID=2767469 RepID=UPI0035C93FCB
MLVHSTCRVINTNVAVDLPQVNTVAFSSGTGAVAGARAFSLLLTCSTGATVSITVSITVTDSVDPANHGSTLQLASGSTAQGVGVQLLNSSGAPIAFGPDSATPGNTNQWTVGASPNGTLQIPMTARYVRTGTVSPGQ